LIGLSWFLVIL